MNIDIGGQKHRDDMNGKWKIVDILEGADYVVNLNKGKLPFKDNSVDNIYCSHTLEHVEPKVLPTILKEMSRILKKSGTIRIIVPDCEKAMKWYFENPKILEKKGMPFKWGYIPKTKMGYLQAWFYTPKTGHRIGFDWELLSTYVKNTGFKEIIRSKHDNCSKIFKGKDKQIYEKFSIYLEAIK